MLKLVRQYIMRKEDSFDSFQKKVYMPRGLFQDCLNCFQLIEFEKEKEIIVG